jgi:hypothetical protein
MVGSDVEVQVKQACTEADLRLVVRVADRCVGEPLGDSSIDSPLSLDDGCRFAIMLHIMENTCSQGLRVCWLHRMVAT